MIKRTVLFCSVWFCSCPVYLVPTLLLRVREDFKTVSGVVVMPTGEEYLIDLDASQGVMAGDLFSVVGSRCAGSAPGHRRTARQISFDPGEGVLCR
ncbi:MAG: hypothetical protein MH213_12335 [Marinobacter sp.]|nr:hypothetical protein [Marinobacter sp.]